MSHRSRWLTLAVVAAAVLVARPLWADDPDTPKDKDAKAGKKADAGPKPPTAKAEAGPLTAAVTLKGVVEAESAAEVQVRPKAWMGPLLVKKAVPHGAAVKAGDVVVEFDAEKLEQAVKDARQERELADLSIKMAELELPILQKQSPLDLAAAEREAKNAADDLDKFLKVDKPLSVEAAGFALKSSEFYLESAKDELKQLEKMYKDKDLTEETETMILKRYKQSVEQAEFSLKQSRNRTKQTLEVDLPRREQATKDAATKADISLAKAKESIPLALRQKALGLEKAKYEQAKARERLADLEKDLAAMTVKAPADGMAYHGKYARGQWSTPGGPAGLAAGAMVQPNDVFLTVVDPGKVAVRADADEKERARLKAGQAARYSPTADPDGKLAGEVAAVGAAPLGGRFEVRVKLDGKADGLVPGTTGSVRVVTAKKESAVTVPAAVVFSDDDGDGKYVYLPAADGAKPKKKPVTVGLTAGDKVEITDGLAAGDEVLTAKP
ncbi:MAG: HlyD family efflux transporter periplasmic adaptor subunit [Gemmataceae bacterium]|nr:HlyD family efflux transporter periplasmic adaptor subunit [Gemmataceae bacterium]